MEHLHGCRSTYNRQICKYIVLKKKCYKSSKIDAFYPVIASLLSEDLRQVIYFQHNLWEYPKDNYSLVFGKSTFCIYVLKFFYRTRYFTYISSQSHLKTNINIYISYCVLFNNLILVMEEGAFLIKELRQLVDTLATVNSID